VIAGALETVLAVAVATALVAALQHAAPAGALFVLYMPAVLVVAIRRGQLAAFATVLVSALVVNYLFIAPRHQLRIAHSRDVVELIVLMLTASVVGRLAAVSRARAAEAEARAAVAAAREREAELLADVAAAIAEGRGTGSLLRPLGLRLGIESAPAPADGERAVALRSRLRGMWLYVRGEELEVDRLVEPLSRLIDVAVERDRVAAQSAEATAIRRGQELQRALLHAVSHDLRSPLTAIATAGSALRGDVSLGEREELLDVIEGEGKRLARMVEDLLDLSRIEGGATAPRTDWCDVHDPVAAVVGGLGAAGERVQLQIPLELPLLRVDSAQLERVLANLLENALKHSPVESPVVVSAGVGGGRVTVRVTDHGDGIPQPERARVFEPFFRGRGRRGSGSGLGLAICRGLVEANGGQILLSSDRALGTSFAVSFPVVEQPPVPVAGVGV
jgi:two-component system, OmpR family, sensor histidine kinase KdpD